MMVEEAKITFQELLQFVQQTPQLAVDDKGMVMMMEMVSDICRTCIHVLCSSTNDDYVDDDDDVLGEGRCLLNVMCNLKYRRLYYV